MFTFANHRNAIQGIGLNEWQKLLFNARYLYNVIYKCDKFKQIFKMEKQELTHIFYVWKVVFFCFFFCFTLPTHHFIAQNVLSLKHD